MPVVFVAQPQVTAIKAVMAKAVVSDGRHASDCSMDVPLVTNLAANGAACLGWLRNVEPMGRCQAFWKELLGLKLLQEKFL